jgi:hypothetical protein
MSERIRKRTRKAEEGLTLDDDLMSASVPVSPKHHVKTSGLDALKSSVTLGRKPRKPSRSQLDDTFDLFKMSVLGSQRAARDGHGVRDGALKFSHAHMNAAASTAATLLGLSGGSTSSRSIPRIGNLDGSAGGIIPAALQSQIHDSARGLVRTLTNPLVRRWVRSEFMYAGVDRGFFLRNEFVECLADMGLAHVTKLTRTEWAAIKGRLGRPRVLSKTFLEQERGKLDRYRVDMRRVQMSLLPRASTIDGPFVYLCPRPMSSGQRATCPHPLFSNVLSTCTIVEADVKSGSYIVTFDRVSDGTYRVADTDVIPHGDLEILYPALSSIIPQDKSQSTTVSKGDENSTSSTSGQSYIPFDPWRLGNDNTGHNLTNLFSSLLPAKAIPHGTKSFLEKSCLLIPDSGTLQAQQALVSALAETNPPPSIVAPTAIAMCSIDPVSKPLPAFGQPVRVAISDEAELILRAFSTLDGSTALSSSSRRFRGGVASVSNIFSNPNAGAGGAFWSSHQHLQSPLALAGSATAAAQALPLLPLHTLGAATAAVVSFAAHCACALSAAHAEELRISSSLNSILQRKDSLLLLLRDGDKEKLGVNKDTTNEHGIKASSTATTSTKLIDEVTKGRMIEELKTINASAEIHFKALRRISRIQTRAADGASAALEGSGLAPPPTTSIPSIQHQSHVDSSFNSSTYSLSGVGKAAVDSSPFVSVAIESASILANDPTVTGQAGLALLQPQAAERLDGVRIRSTHKAAKAAARAIKTALTTATANTGGGGSGNSTTTKKGLVDAACTSLLTASSNGNVPVLNYVNAALGVLLAAQGASDPGCGLSAVEGFVAVQRALSAVAPEYARNNQLYLDLCASMAALRTLGHL